jgi:hypothetical protein
VHLAFLASREVRRRGCIAEKAQGRNRSCSTLCSSRGGRAVVTQRRAPSTVQTGTTRGGPEALIYREPHPLSRTVRGVRQSRPQAQRFQEDAPHWRKPLCNAGVNLQGLSRRQGSYWPPSATRPEPMPGPGMGQVRKRRSATFRSRQAQRGDLGGSTEHDSPHHDGDALPSPIADAAPHVWARRGHFACISQSRRARRWP